mmetsp:Transcript_6007/g.18876  ORF Transcript_6007/g.18876 Transcript_6007/m.18876 type:complete len:279 (+) Transcript_6007:86-922(+)
MSKKGAVLVTMSLATIAALGRWLSIEPFCAVAVAMQLAVYLVDGLPNRTERCYDLSGSATHVCVVVMAVLLAPRKTPRHLLASFAAVVWAARLGTYLFLRIAKDKRDGRFDKLRHNAVGFLAAWTIQALWVVVVELPVLLLARDEDAGLSVRDGLGLALWLAGFVLELVADTQKFAFRCEHPDAFVHTGVWRFSRHPNFAGEIAAWVGLAIVASPTTYAAWLSPAFTALLLTKGTGIPPLEKAAQARYGGDPAFVHYTAHTSVLLPWFPAPPLQNKNE